VKTEGLPVPAAYLPEGTHSTFLFGVFRPCVYLPKGLSQRETEYILAHEFSHLRRGDHIVKPLFWLLACVHWMNPLAWLAFYLFEMDMEQSCDERVLLRMAGKNHPSSSLTAIKKEYSSVLLKLSAKRHFSGGQPLALGENSVKERIRGILRYKSTKLWISVTAVLIVAAVCVGLALNPVSDGNGNANSSSVIVTFPEELNHNGDGKDFSVSLTLPEGLSVTETTEEGNSNLPLPSFAISKDGEEVGSLSFYPFATDDSETLQEVDNSSAELPMQVYATIALANHVNYHNEYEVVSFTETASNAVCRPLIHDIANYGGHTPDAPWIERDGVLAYDMAGEPYFLSIVLKADLLSHQQLAELAKSVSFYYE